ncbi:MAG: hypothetical protein WEB06_09330 [Actinomycetota bacterium]
MSGADHNRSIALRALTVSVAVVTLMALATTGFARPVKKEFDASIAPGGGPGQTATSLTVTITNLPTSQHPVGSANITIPPGFTGIGTPTISSAPSGKSWTATLNGGVIELRSASGSQLAPGESVAVTFVATTPCPEGAYAFGVQAKQSNNFNGQGNDIVTGPSTLTFTVSGGCEPAAVHLAFGQQPTDVISGATMTPAVTVRVEDASNNLVTGFSGTVSLALGANPGSSTLFGGGPVAVSNGVATFDGLMATKTTVGTVTGHTLVATSDPSVTSATSGAFAVTGMSSDCEFELCTGNSGILSNASSSDNWIGKVEVDTGECPEHPCLLTVYEQTTCPEGFTCKSNLLTFIPPANAQGLTTVTIACDTTICPNVGPPGNGEPLYKVLANGTVVVLDRCHNSPPSGDDLTNGCIVEVIRTRPGDTVFTILLPEGDPAIFK